MARYRKVDPRIWNDARFIKLCDRGKLAFLFILTHPHMTALGAMRATTSGLAAELGWSAKQFDDAIGDAISSGMVEANADASYIGLPRFLRYNEPEGPNSVSNAWLESLGLIPECREKHILIARCRRYLDARSQKFRDALKEEIWSAFDMPSDMPSGMASDMASDMASCEPCRIQEQEQEQDLNKQRGEKPKPTAAEFDEFWNAYPTREGRRLYKTKAAEAFQKLNASDVPGVMAAVRNYAKSDRVAEGYVKDPFRFLQAGFWREWASEEIPPAPKKSPEGPTRLCFQ